MSNTPVTPSSSIESTGSSFEERSVWIQLVSLCLVLGGYFLVAGRMLSAGVSVLPPYVPVFAVAVALLVIVIVAGHIVAAISRRPEAGSDERDRLIAWRAESLSGWVVAVGVLAGITCMILAVPNVWTAHLLLLSLFLSELLKLVLQLVFYRRGF